MLSHTNQRFKRTRQPRLVWRALNHNKRILLFINIFSLVSQPIVKINWFRFIIIYLFFTCLHQRCLMVDVDWLRVAGVVRRVVALSGMHETSGGCWGLRFATTSAIVVEITFFACLSWRGVIVSGTVESTTHVVSTRRNNSICVSVYVVTWFIFTLTASISFTQRAWSPVFSRRFSHTKDRLIVGCFIKVLACVKLLTLFGLSAAICL